MNTKELAIELHNNFCNANHVDQCAWMYHKDGDDHDWSSYSHERWFRKAEEFVETDLGRELVREDRIDELIELMEKV